MTQHGTWVSGETGAGETSVERGVSAVIPRDRAKLGRIPDRPPDDAEHGRGEEVVDGVEGVRVAARHQPQARSEVTAYTGLGVLLRAGTVDSRHVVSTGRLPTGHYGCKLAPRGLISPTAACAAVPPRDHLAAMPTALRRSTTWGFAIYRASHEDHQDSILLSGYPAGTSKEALDCACGLYLGDTTAWLTRSHPRRINRRA